MRKMGVALIVALCGIAFLPQTFAGGNKSEEKPLEIWMQQTRHPNYKTSFYMWVEGDMFTFEGTTDTIETGISLGGKAYVSGKNIHHAMVFMKQYDAPAYGGDHVKIVVGRYRSEDVTIYVPKGRKVRFIVQTIDDREKKQ